MDIAPKAYLGHLMAYMRQTFTPEQEEIILNFNNSCLVWADPGTGKTTTVVAGLYMATHMFKIPANKIFALSFTNVATSEMATRFYRIAKRARIATPQVSFRTLHSLAMRVIVENYNALGMKAPPKIGDSHLKSVVQKLEAVSADAGANFEGSKLRQLAQAILNLNSSLTFDEESVRSKTSFKKLHMDYDTFTFYRYKIYMSNIRSKAIPQGETCLYALAILEANPAISAKYKEQIELLVVDESQDMSLLQLRLASLLCNKLIMIGDIKQQIYAFNGACAEIIDEYRTLYPTATEYKLTQSFRCGQKIADFATRLILPNNTGGEDFTGTDKSETVDVVRGLNYENVIQELRQGMRTNNNVLTRDVMFAARNNVALVPIMDVLFANHIPAQIPKYMPMNEIPVIKELAQLTELAMRPDFIDNGLILNKVIPEFSKYGAFGENPIMSICKKDGVPMTAVRYKFRTYEAQKLMEDLLEVQELLHKKAPVSDLFNQLWGSFNALYLDYHKRYLEQEPKYYISLVARMLRQRTYREFIDIEREKHNFFDECTRKMIGVKCFTFHSCKGMEADEVYLFEVEEGLLPNDNRMDEMIKAKCELEAAIALRNERNLLYVGCTRAKTKLVVAYDGALAKLVMGETKYGNLDRIYASTNVRFEDIKYFVKFSKGEIALV
jgi:superfamily I DNA/RNA helicase